jgi:hypothetical protein
MTTILPTYKITVIILTQIDWDYLFYVRKADENNAYSSLYQTISQVSESEEGQQLDPMAELQLSLSDELGLDKKIIANSLKLWRINEADNEVREANHMIYTLNLNEDDEVEGQLNDFLWVDTEEALENLNVEDTEVIEKWLGLEW